MIKFKFEKIEIINMKYSLFLIISLAISTTFGQTENQSNPN